MIEYRTIAILDGKVLRRERLAKGLTQKQIAKKAGLSTAFICDVEKGRREAVEDTALNIRKAVRSL